MPELPEVETIKRNLGQTIGSPCLDDVKIHDPLVLSDSPEQLKAYKGCDYQNAERLGKYLILHFGETRKIIISLRMTGTVLLNTINNRTAIEFNFENNDNLSVNTVRRFTRVYCRNQNYKNEPPLKKLGPDPLYSNFTLNNFKQTLQSRRAILKNLLLNQEVVAGIGNIYASEILYQAGLHPEKKANTLSKEQIRHIYNAIPTVLDRAIKNGGSSLSDYQNLFGEKGTAQNTNIVYQKNNTPCPKCSTLIEKKKISNRSTYYCPNCQDK